jgi:hypothetical protein
LIQEFLSFDSAETIKKLLDCVEGCAVQFLGTPQQAETHAKLAVQGLGVIANNVQTTALRGSFRPEGADNYMTSGLDRVGYLAHICNALFRRCQKVEHCTVVPHIVGARLQLRLRDVSDEPMDMFRGRPQPLLVRIDGSLRNIKDIDVLVSASKQVVDESGLATADVDYGRGVLGRCTFYKFKGGFKVRTVPVDRVRGLLGIDIFPVALCIHSVSVDRLSVIISQSPMRRR